MKRSLFTAFLAWLGAMAAFVASAAFTAPAGATSPNLASTSASAAGKVVALTAGAVHTCATLEDKSVQCWGNNQYGELGNGTIVNANKPGPVKGLPAPPELTSSRAVHTCSLMGDGTVQCWGMNAYSQLGDGTNKNSPKPLAVKGLGDKVRLLGVGGDHTCVTLENDSTWCWGQNKYGELGDGKIYTISHKPVQVKGMPSPPVKLVASLWHTCAILEDDSTWCWGHNQEGELGIGTKLVSSPKPVKLTGLPSTPVQLTAGLNHTCALVQDGSTWCWGQGKYGQLGHGTTEAAWAPKPVVGLPRNPTHLVAGGFHTCANFANGTMSCWGQNAFGQLGDGTNKNALKPVTVKGLRPGATMIAGGSLHTCAGYEDGEVTCWGLNASGQLGSGTKANAMKPVAVVGLAKATTAPSSSAPATSAPAPSTSAPAPATSAPATSTAPVASTEQDDDDGVSAGLITGIILVVLAAAGAAIYAATRKRRA